MPRRKGLPSPSRCSPGGFGSGPWRYPPRLSRQLDDPPFRPDGMRLPAGLRASTNRHRMGPMYPTRLAFHASRRDGTPHAGSESLDGETLLDSKPGLPAHSKSQVPVVEQEPRIIPQLVGVVGHETIDAMLDN